MTDGSSTDGTAGLLAYTIGAGGALTPKTVAAYATGKYPQEIAISPNGGSLYVINSGRTDGTAALSAYSIGSNGALTAGATYSTGVEPEGIAISPDGGSLYVINNTQDGANGLSAYSIGAGGALTAITSGTLTTGLNPRGIAICPTKK